jgi:hypothetical protein
MGHSRPHCRKEEATLLTRTYAGAEKGKVQALNDFLVFGTVTLSSFVSGAMPSGGWLDHSADCRCAVRRSRWGGGAVVAPPGRERHPNATPRGAGLNLSRRERRPGPIQLDGRIFWLIWKKLAV